jgi:hypothetical protein
MKVRLALVFLVALPIFGDEMRKLDFLAGDWKGEAQVLSGPGKGEQALQTETVRWKLGGKALVVEGIGRKKLDGGAAGEIVHDALGVVWYDDAAKQFRFDAWTAARGHVDAWFEAGDDNSARWGFDVPGGGKIRFTISLNDKGQWHEVGEYSPDGSRWFKTMEMTLTKVK